MTQKKSHFFWYLIIGIIILVVVFFLFKEYILPALVGAGGILGFLFKKKTGNKKIEKIEQQASVTDAKAKKLNEEAEILERNARENQKAVESMKKQAANTDAKVKEVNNEAEILKKKAQEDQQAVESMKQQASITDAKVEELNKKTESRKEREQRRRSGGSGTALILLALIFLGAGTTWAASSNLYIPKDYNELKKLYIEADQDLQEADATIEEQKQLIAQLQKERDQALQKANGSDLEKALKIIEEQKQLIAQLQKERDQALEKANCPDLEKALKIIEEQKQVIAQLQKERNQALQVAKDLSQQWGITPGFQLGEGFTLGVSQKNDSFSWGLGVTGKGSLFGNLAFWF